MNMSRVASNAELGRVRQELRGATCWSARRGHGTFITLDLGERQQHTTMTGGVVERGEYHLWLYMAKWQMVEESKSVDWNSANAVVEQVLQHCVGSFVTAICGPPVTIRMKGRSSTTFVLKRMEDADQYEPLFMLYMPQRRVLSANQDGVLRIGDDREVW